MEYTFLNSERLSPLPPGPRLNTTIATIQDLLVREYTVFSFFRF